MPIRIKLVGCTTYTYGPKGEKFEKGYEYELEDDKALTLLASTDARTGMPFFTRVERPAPMIEEQVVEETTGDGIGGVRIIRKKATPRANPKVKTSGDTSPLRDDGKERVVEDGDDDAEGAVDV